MAAFEPRFTISLRLLSLVEQVAALVVKVGGKKTGRYALMKWFPIRRDE